MNKTIINQAEALRLKLTKELADVKRERAKLKRAGLIVGTIYEKKGGYMMLNTQEDGRRRRLYLGKPDSKEVKDARASIAREQRDRTLASDEANIAAGLRLLETSIKDAMHAARSRANGQSYLH